MPIFLGENKVGPIIQVPESDADINKAYAKQMDGLDAISGKYDRTGEYTNAEITRLENELKNMTEGVSNNG